MSKIHQMRLLLLLVGSLSLIGVVCVSCGETNQSTQTSASANRAQVATNTLTHAQTIVAGNAVCVSTTDEIQPIAVRMDAIQKSNASRQEVDRKAGPLLEQIARGVRGNARSLQELHASPSDAQALATLAGGFLELAVIEEQLAQALRENETSRAKIVSAEVRATRPRATAKAVAFGFQKCGFLSQIPVP